MIIKYKYIIIKLKKFEVKILFKFKLNFHIIFNLINIFTSILIKKNRCEFYYLINILKLNL